MKAFACWEGAPWGNVASGKRKAPRAERERRTAFRAAVGEQSGALAAGAEAVEVTAAAAAAVTAVTTVTSAPEEFEEHCEEEEPLLASLLLLPSSILS